MASKKKNNPKLDVSVSVGGTNTLVGEIISINLKETTYFGVGPIWLTPNKYWARIPPNLSEQDYDIILNGLKAGTIVKGKTYIPPIDKSEGVLDDYWQTIKRYGIREETKSKFRDLAINKRWVDGGYTFIEIALHCKEKEKATKYRSEVISWLDHMLEQAEGPLRLYDPPSDEEGLQKLVFNKNGTVTEYLENGKTITHMNKDTVEINKAQEEANIRAATNKPAPKPSSHKGGTKSKSEALGSVLD